MAPFLGLFALASRLSQPKSRSNATGPVSPFRWEARLGGEMPPTAKNGYISQRDVEVLGFIARFGVVPRSAVQLWAGTGRTATFSRERRLRDAALVEVRSGVWGKGRLLACTSAGLRVAGFGHLRPARFRLEAVAHDSAVAELGAHLEREGQRLVSEREMLAQERIEGERILSAEVSEKRFHRADLLRVDRGEPPEAIEVELTAKGAHRLDELLRAWRRAVADGRFSRVVYRCTPSTLRLVERAVERTKSDSVIHVESL
jgi:hypothetical protein